MPRFLDTCTGDARKIVVNHGVELLNDEAGLIARVVQLCLRLYYMVKAMV